MTSDAPAPFSRRVAWIRGRYSDLSTGRPIIGRHLQAVPSARSFVDPAGHRVLGPSTVVGVTDSNGYVAIALQVTDDERLSPQGWTWEITDPLRRTFSISVPSDLPLYDAPDPAPGQDPDPLDGLPVIDLADVYPGAASNGGTVVVTPGPQGIQGVPGPPLAPPITLDYAPSIAIDCALGDHFRITLNGPLYLDTPVNAPDGHRLFIELSQDEVGSRALTLGPIFNPGFDIVTVELSIEPGSRDHIGAMFNADVNSWDVVGVIRGY